MALIQKAAQSPSMETDMGRGLVDILSRYTQTFLWLQQYDEGLLKEPEGQSGGRLLKTEDAMNTLLDLKDKMKQIIPLFYVAKRTIHFIEMRRICKPKLIISL